MAWRRPGDKSLSEPMVVSLLTHICVTRPQWVKPLMSKCIQCLVVVTQTCRLTIMDSHHLDLVSQMQCFMYTLLSSTQSKVWSMKDTLNGTFVHIISSPCMMISNCYISFISPWSGVVHVFVYGGRGVDCVYDDAYLLNTENWTWTKVSLLQVIYIMEPLIRGLKSILPNLKITSFH